MKTAQIAAPKNRNIGVSADTNPPQYIDIAVAVGSGYLTYEQAQFVYRAANAYPKLIEALRGLKRTDILDTTAGETVEQHAARRSARSLLRELGEEE